MADSRDRCCWPIKKDISVQLSFLGGCWPSCLQPQTFVPEVKPEGGTVMDLTYSTYFPVLLKLPRFFVRPNLRTSAVWWWYNRGLVGRLSSDVVTLAHRLCSSSILRPCRFLFVFPLTAHLSSRFPGTLSQSVSQSDTIADGKHTPTHTHTLRPLHCLTPEVSHIVKYRGSH